MTFELVTLRVGEPNVAVDIPVYREVLAGVSPYFRGAFKSSFKEATGKFLPLTHVSEQTFRIFLQWAHMQAKQDVGGEVPGIGALLPRREKDVVDAADDPEVSSPNADDECMSGPAVDEKMYHLGRPHRDDKAYFENKEWLANFRSTVISYLRLYIFADKYNVHQLRDDILTAFVAQVHACRFWPDPDKELIQFAYANLPASSKLLRFFVLSAAYLWLPDGDCAAKMRAMQVMHTDFAFEVSLVQAQMLQNRQSEEDGMPFALDDAVPNSCVLHEHLVHGKKQCRDRIRNNPHIFATLVDGCVQDARGMASEQNDN
jgi:hypothetical protein